MLQVDRDTIIDGNGLITPVIKHADRKGLVQISREVKEMAGRAREKRLQPDEYTGATFSVSNLGMFGIHEFTAIIELQEIRARWVRQVPLAGFPDAEVSEILSSVAPPDVTPPDAFPNLDPGNVHVTYKCPRCKYEWSGSPD